MENETENEIENDESENLNSKSESEYDPNENGSEIENDESDEEKNIITSEQNNLKSVRNISIKPILKDASQQDEQTSSDEDVLEDMPGLYFYFAYFSFFFIQ